MNRREFVKITAMAGAGVALFKGFEGSAWAYSQSPILRKFVSPLPGLGTGLPIANGTLKKDGSVLYKLVARQFHQQMHPDLPKPTKLWGYMDQTTGVPAYLGPVVVSRRNQPVRIRMKNNLPSVHPLPVDTMLMGADNGAAANRICVHLHGGLVPWNMDGGPFSWFAPDGTHGINFTNGVPGMLDTAEYYYPNNQSTRLMWFHDHALGITRLNAYAGLAAGYLVTDAVYDSLTSPKSGPPLVPPLNYTIPLVLQEKTFKTVADQWGRPGDLWYPYLYESNQGSVAGRWDLGTPSDGFVNKGLPGSPSCVPEFFGDTPVINGEAYPFVEVEPRRYLLTFLNGSQARFFNLSLFYESALNPKEPDFGKAGPAFLQVGNEGGLLPDPAVFAKISGGTFVNENSNNLMPRIAPDEVDPEGPRNLLLAPAERAMVIVDFSNVPVGSRLILYSDAPSPFPGGDSRNDYFTGDSDQTLIGGAPTTKLGKGPNTRTLMQFRVVRLKGARDPHTFATTLSALGNGGLKGAYDQSHLPFGEPDLNPHASDVLFENKTLNEDFDGNGRLIQRVGTGQQLYADSFGRNYDDAPTEVYNNGQVVLWDVYNNTADTHPMHFHLSNVQVLGRAPFTTVGIPDGPFQPPDDNYRGWKETVRMNPGQVTRVIMQFTLPSNLPFTVPPSPRTGGNEYVWHCHILEHEEHDMMRPLIVL
jgi:spore coat protein A